LLSGAALPRIQQGMIARAAHIHGLLTDARRLRDDAEQHKNDMSSAADTAYARAHAILNKAAAEAQDAANRRNHELEAILQSKQKASEEKINTARANAVQSVHDAAHMLVPAIAQKLAGLRLTDRQIADALNDAHGSNDNGHHSARGVA
jgi:F-type H+-transporting ATPase subunit b